MFNKDNKELIMQYALKINQLYKTYNNGFKALKGIDLTVEQGDFFALLGANGAGKSTTIGIISSLIYKTSGLVEIFGFDLDQQRNQAKSMIGLVPQEFNFNIFEPVQEVLINQGGYYGISRQVATQRSEALLKQLGLWEKRAEIGRNLSGGMKRRLLIARALIHQPKLLILDEPTAGVDIEIRRKMWEFLSKINAAGTTIILTTHYLEEAEKLCRNIAILEQGHVVTNCSMKQLLQQLSNETLILDLQQPLTQLPDNSPYLLHQHDEYTLEIQYNKSHSINELFRFLTQHNIEVASLRNKTNRLEELFIHLVEQNKEQ
jgi:ABC-2 type transport system ATP-binding protein